MGNRNNLLSFNDDVYFPKKKDKTTVKVFLETKISLKISENDNSFVYSFNVNIFQSSDLDIVFLSFHSVLTDFHGESIPFPGFYLST